MRRLPDGTLLCGRPELDRIGDAVAVAIAVGRAQVWVHGKRVPLPLPVFVWEAARYHGRGGERLGRGAYPYVPLSLLVHAFDAVIATSEAGAVATLRLTDERVLQFARGNVGCIVDGRVTAMYAEAALREGELWISSNGSQQRSAICTCRSETACSL